MGKYCEFNKLLCEEIFTELGKFKERRDDVSLHRAKELLEAAVDLQALEAAGAMRRYFEEEKGYNSETERFDRWDYPYPHRVIYNMGDKRMMNPPMYPDWDGRYNDDYDGVMDAARRERDSMGRYTSAGRDGRGRGRMMNDGRGMDGDYGSGYRIYNHTDMKDAYRKRKLTTEEYKTWMDEMEHADGGTGAMWSIEETTSVGKKVGVDFEKHDKMVFCVAMNMMYSDYCEVASKFNVNKPEFYACMAKAFLDDEDSLKWGEKLSAYYNAVVDK